MICHGISRSGQRCTTMGQVARDWNIQAVRWFQTRPDQCRGRRQGRLRPPPPPPPPPRSFLGSVRPDELERSAAESHVRGRGTGQGWPLDAISPGTAPRDLTRRGVFASATRDRRATGHELHDRTVLSLLVLAAVVLSLKNTQRSGARSSCFNGCACTEPP